MKIKITALILTLVLCLSLSFNAFAEEHPPRLVDDADLLDEYEEEEILQKLDEASERYQIDFVIVTVENNGGKTSRDFADDYFDYNGYGLGEGYDGILLLITQRDEYGERALYISTHGKGITLLPDYRIEDLGDKMAEAFEENGYAEMFDTFIRQTESYIRYDNGEFQHPPRLVDNSDLLDEYEEAERLQKLNEASERYQIDFVIVTVENNGGKTSRDFADDYFDYNGYGLGEGYDGVLLLITQNDENGKRSLWISTHGKGITLLPDYRIEELGGKMAEAFEDGGYAEMFDTFIRQTESYIRYDNGELEYDDSYDPLYYFDFESAILISLFIGFLVAIIATSIMKGKLKSVRFKREADSYVKSGSMNVTDSKDIYLYSTVSRRARPKDTGSGGRSGGSSTHTSSSGRTHGGGGRSF